MMRTQLRDILEQAASHMHQALPTRMLRDSGLLSLLKEHGRLASV